MTLYPGEQVLWSGKQVWKSEITSFIAAIVLILIGLSVFAVLGGWPFGLGLGLLIILGAVLRVLTSEYALTNRRVYIKYGLISRAVSDIPIENITDALLLQNFLGRLLKYGHLRVNTASSGGMATLMTGFMRGVEDPVGLRAKIDSIRESLRSSRQSQDRLQRLDDELLYGRISKQQYDYARAQIASTAPAGSFNQQAGMAQPGAPGYPGQAQAWPAQNAPGAPYAQNPAASYAPQQQAAPPMAQAPSQASNCPSCGKPLTWNAQYSRWFCGAENKWI